ncbi:sulfotransferase [Ascidiaceihabitans sp.]|nr:sulfotransferase [Ascidiaceihabitans sp.]
MRDLDFLIIGAQKSGTTTLWKLLDEHPGVYVPPGKELAFFNKDPYKPEAYSMFIKEHFSRAGGHQVIGKATPHYLSDPMTASRIIEKLPDCKLIVILRDPVDRALSHFRMSVRRELETRSFEEMVTEELHPEALKNARSMRADEISENHTYLAWGEYGRLLNAYRFYYENGQLLVLFTADLEKNPDATMKKILDFIGQPIADLPSLGQKLHQGGIRQKLPILSYLKKIPILRSAWRLVPERFRKQFYFSFSQWNIAPSSDNILNYSAEIILLLRKHFSQDDAALREFINSAPPWPAFDAE